MNFDDFDLSVPCGECTVVLRATSEAWGVGKKRVQNLW